MIRLDTKTRFNIPGVFHPDGAARYNIGLHSPFPIPRQD